MVYVRSLSAQNQDQLLLSNSDGENEKNVRERFLRLIDEGWRVKKNGEMFWAAVTST